MATSRMVRKPSKVKGYDLAQWGGDQKLQAAASYIMLGNLKEVSDITGIPYITLKVWKTTDWWKDLILEIRDEDISQLDAKLQKIVSKALVAVEDRLDKGDYQYDPKTGKPVRIPVKAHIALKVTTDLLARQEKIRSAPQRAEVEKTIDARLSKLADEFARFAKGGTRTINVEDLPELSKDPVLTPIQQAAVDAYQAVPVVPVSEGSNPPSRVDVTPPPPIQSNAAPLPSTFTLAPVVDKPYPVNPVMEALRKQLQERQRQQA